MGVIKKIGKFGLGGAVGSLIGVAGGLFLAPDSGTETQRKVRERIRTANVAGIEAQASKERELINRFRGETNDRGALADAETESNARLENRLAEFK